MAKFWKSLSILKNDFKISGKYFEKSLLPDCPDWKENSTMIKKSYVPFYQSLILLFLLAVVASVSKNTCILIFFNKFSSNIEKFLEIGLEFLSFTTRKQQHTMFKKKKKSFKYCLGPDLNPWPTRVCLEGTVLSIKPRC